MRVKAKERVRECRKSTGELEGKMERLPGRRSLVKYLPC
jgi:hypothetical protein